MKPLTINNPKVKNEAQKQILKRLKELQPCGDRLDYVLTKINKGNLNAIDDLLNSAEELILKVMMQIPESRYSIDDQLIMQKKR
jgi:hypothetical protein